MLPSLSAPNANIVTSGSPYRVVLKLAMPTVLAMLAFFAGLRRTGPSAAAIMSMFEPVVTTGLAALTLDEFLTPVQLAGALVVLSSAALVQLRPRRRQAVPSNEQAGVLAPSAEPVRLG